VGKNFPSELIDFGMKTKFLCVLFIAFVISWKSFAQVPVCPMGQEWVFEPAFSDEFEGKALDYVKWWDFNPAWHGRKPAYFSRENVRVKNGLLLLTAREQKPSQVTVENKVRGYDKYTKSIVKSKERILYGYFEARCKTMDAAVCNAFWLYDPLDAPEKYEPGDFSEEIDIFEVFGKRGSKKEVNCERMYYATIHRMTTPYVESVVKNPTTLPDRTISKSVPFDFQADFHTYGFLWTPEVMKWFLDGEEVFSRKNDFFKRPLNIVLDCEIMEGWVGLPDPADLPAVFQVDYVRVWKQPAQ
jgi:beta-glucanase (GH16 family)